MSILIRFERFTVFKSPALPEVMTIFPCSLESLDEAAIVADEPRENIPIISLPPDFQVGRVIHGNLQRDYNHELN